MNGTKQWWQSKTIWGIIIAALGFLVSNVLHVPDVNLPSDATVDQAQAAIAAIKAAQGNMAVIIGHIATLAGLVISVIGRVKAEQKIA